MREAAANVGQESAVIQGLGEETGSQQYREFQIRAESLSQQDEQRLLGELRQDFDAESLGTRTVSASFSEDILRGAIWAVIISFVLIAGYVAIRFQWRFAVPILRTIVNDGLIAIGIYSFSGREVSAATVAAFLTIIGYSIYDTIIIFDRVRENLGLMRRASVKELINVSLWETIPRSLATTFITLLPVSVLFFFGGETLKDFAFAILIGIGISAFSTIFIAAPFLAVLLEQHGRVQGTQGHAHARRGRRAARRGRGGGGGGARARDPAARADRRRRRGRRRRGEARASPATAQGAPPWPSPLARRGTSPRRCSRGRARRAAASASARPRTSARCCASSAS